jgi:predicted DNA-binding transcriptional regulator AlpA
MNTIQQYPTVLKAKHVAEILGVSEPTAYAYMRRTDFPTINLPGSVKRVAREAFFNWLEGKQQTQRS